MYIHIRVFTGQKKEEIFEQKPGYFDVFVREKPEQNIANKKTLDLIAKHFSIPVSEITIISGHHKPTKIISLVEPSVESSLWYNKYRSEV